MGWKARKGIYYFKTFVEAKLYGTLKGWNTDRIIAYEVGWAIQKCISGDYYGPKDEEEMK
jgi:hypothetical protein